jgi:hypothetical protein
MFKREVLVWLALVGTSSSRCCSAWSARMCFTEDRDTPGSFEESSALVD